MDDLPIGLDGQAFSCHNYSMTNTDPRIARAMKMDRDARKAQARRNVQARKDRKAA